MKTIPNILIVDDSRELCISLRDILDEKGYTVECTHNGGDAIALSREHIYDIVIIDIKLPDIPGTEVVSEIAKILPSAEFIYMTGYASINSAIEAVKQENVISYETKPLNLDRLLAFIKQITGRKKSEKALKESELRYRQLFEDSPIAICEEDFSELKTCLDKLKGEGVLDFYKYFEKNPDALKTCAQKVKVLDVNKAALELYQAENKEELLGNLNKTFTEKSFEVFKDEIIAIVNGADRFEAEAEAQTLTGKIRYIYLRFHLRPAKDGNLDYSRALVVTSDITEHKKMQEALLQSEKLKSIGTITAGIAHDFNNILAIISGNVQLLESGYKNHEELMNALHTIMKATNDGAEISRRMLKFTQTEKSTTGFKPHDAGDLIKQAIVFTKHRWKNIAQAEGTNYHLNTEGIKKAPSILCNPAELREVFVNIINNALDAMPDGGDMSFSTWSNKDTVFIRVSDTGEGMSEEVKGNIFDPFFTTKLAVGTGLGMSTAYGIISRHGGRIEVESEVGRGSIFTLQFPIAAKADSLNEIPEQENDTKSKRLRIMVIDDEAAICEILDKYLSGCGHMVRTVDNGAEAIILAGNDDYDLVLCDIAMPGVFGYDVIKALNGLERRPKIGIITGWGEDIKPIKEGDVKVDFIIKKPFDFSMLTKQINDLGIGELRDWGIGGL